MEPVYRIPVTLRQQQYWEFASARRNVNTFWFGNCDVEMQDFAKLETHQQLQYTAKCVGAKLVVMTVGCDWAIRNGGGVHYRTALFSGEAICYTLAGVTLCTLL